MFVCQEEVVQPSCEMEGSAYAEEEGTGLDMVLSDLTDTSVN